MSILRNPGFSILLVGFILLAFPVIVERGFAQQGTEKGYLDYLDSYYETQDVGDLTRARNSIKSDLDSSMALRFQGYYYNTEIQYLLAVEELRKDPQDIKKQEKLKGLMLQLYNRYLDSYYEVDRADIQKSNIPGNTAFLFKDMMMGLFVLINLFRK